MFQELSQALRWHRFDRSRCFWTCQDRERFKSFQEAFSQCLKLGVYEDSAAFYCFDLFWFTIYSIHFSTSSSSWVVSLWFRAVSAVPFQDHTNRELIIPLLRYHSSKSGEAEQQQLSVAAAHSVAQLAENWGDGWAGWVYQPDEARRLQMASGVSQYMIQTW